MTNNLFLEHAKIEVPVICGAMYPCSNPELVAAASDNGGIGIVQPLSLVYAYGYDFRKGLQFIRTKTARPIGMNVITEKSSKVYQKRMSDWLDISLEEGVRFFVTSLGNPKWIVDRVSSVGGIVYHDVTERKWAEKALEGGVKGLILVNNRAGGHAGPRAVEELYKSMVDFNVPLICAGGIGDAPDVVRVLKLGYQGVQMGTRFIATTECQAHQDYKNAIVNAEPSDIVLTDKVSGVPLAVINNPYLEKMGLMAGPIARFFLKNSRTKHWMRLFYQLLSVWKLKKSMKHGGNYKDYYQAGKSVEGVKKIESVADVMGRIKIAIKGM